MEGVGLNRWLRGEEAVDPAPPRVDREALKVAAPPKSVKFGMVARNCTGAIQSAHRTGRQGGAAIGIGRVLVLASLRRTMVCGANPLNPATLLVWIG